METVEHFPRVIKPQEPKYKVVKVMHNSGRKITLQRNLSLDEAKRIVNAYPDMLNAMVVFYKQ